MFRFKNMIVRGKRESLIFVKRVLLHLKFSRIAKITLHLLFRNTLSSPRRNEQIQIL